MTMTLSRHAAPILGLAALAALGLAARPAAAQSVFSFTGGSLRSTTDGSPAAGYTIGYSFTTGSQATSLTALGYYEPNGTFSESHEVGLFTFGGVQLADATVAASTAPSADGFGYATAFTDQNGFSGLLAANTTYLLGGFVGTNVDPFLDHATSVSGADGFTYGSPYLRDPNANGFGAPTTYAGGVTFHAYAGPTLQVAVAPEPSSVAAFAFTGLGAIGLMLKARKRRA